MSHLIGRFKSDQLHPDPPTRNEWLVLSLWQPWASAFFYGLKTIETRGWRTEYRGNLYIHATKKFPPYARAFAAEEYACGRLPLHPSQLPLGCILGSVQLIDVKRTTTNLMSTLSHQEVLYGDFSPGRWAWITQYPKALDTPVPANGSQGFWHYAPVL